MIDWPLTMTNLVVHSALLVVLICFLFLCVMLAEDLFEKELFAKLAASALMTGMLAMTTVVLICTIYSHEWAESFVTKVRAEAKSKAEVKNE